MKPILRGKILALSDHNKNEGSHTSNSMAYVRVLEKDKITPQRASRKK